MSQWGQSCKTQIKKNWNVSEITYKEGSDMHIHIVSTRTSPLIDYRLWSLGGALVGPSVLAEISTAGSDSCTHTQAQPVVACFSSGLVTVYFFLTLTQDTQCWTNVWMQGYSLHVRCRYRQGQVCKVSVFGSATSTNCTHAQLLSIVLIDRGK